MACNANAKFMARNVPVTFMYRSGGLLCGSLSWTKSATASSARPRGNLAPQDAASDG
jgi:hypothetical protein